MGLLPTPKPQGNAAPLAAGTATAEDGVQPSAPGQGMDRDEESNVSPEEQALYDQFVKKAAEFIYTDKGKVEPAILQALSVPDKPAGPDSPGGSPKIMALANAAFQIVKKLDDSANEQGSPIPDDVIEHGGMEIIEELGQVADTAGLQDYSEEDLTGAFLQAVDLFRQHAIDTGRTSEATLKDQFAQIEEADKAGKLGDILPGAGGSTLGEPPVQPGADAPPAP